MITIYSKDNCNHCYILKNDLKRYGIGFEEVNLNTQPDIIIELKEKGFRSLPVVRYGDNWESGYNKDMVNRLTNFANG